MSAVLDLLQDLIRFPCLSHEEGPIADFVEGYVAARGLPVERLDHNVHVSLGEGDDVLLLNSHLDVVPASADHPYPPFEPTLVDGQLYGRGSVDAKASGAAMLTALLELAAAGWTPPGGRLIVALTAAEEMSRTYNGLETLRPHLPPLAAALVGEPTEMQPCVAQKGLLILRVEAHGRTAHAARAHLGDNAITRAARAVQQLDALPFDRADPFLGTPTATVTTIEGGTARNVVPDRCTFHVDIRSTPAYTHDELIAYVAGALDAEVHVHSQRLIPVATDPGARIVQACQAALPDATPFGSPTASDWIYLQDVPTVKIGPGRSERSHTPHEHIAVADVERAVQDYQAIVRAYFATP
ncbi:MAG: M20/M25/M40 family metallo-hydrolase [Bacteroidota bacterium]